MISGAEITTALRGTVRLARFDAGGLALFDNTARGFWNSFFTAVLLMPGMIWLSFVASDDAVIASIPAIRLYAILLIHYVIQWTVFPLVMSTVTQAMGRDHRFVPFVVAYNWSRVVPNTLLILLLAIAGPGALEAAPSLLIMGYAMIFTWFVIRKALDVSGWAAAGIFLLNGIIELFLFSIALALLQAPGAA